MKTAIEMKNEIIAKYAAIPNAQIQVGVYLKTVGYKYVTIVDTWDSTTIHKIGIEKFYVDHVRQTEPF